MGAIQAARMGDAVGAHASHFWGWVGMAVGIVAGALIGTALIIATGGLAAPALMGALLAVSAASGAVALAAGGGALLGRFAHSMFDRPPPPEGASPCGTIMIGLRTVKIEGIMAARQSDPATHNGSMLREGSKTVLMKGKPASRYKDKSSCDGIVIKAAINTFLGGPPADNGASTGDGSVFDAVMNALDDVHDLMEKVSMVTGLAAIAVGASLGGLALLVGRGSLPMLEKMMPLLMRSLPLIEKEAGEIIVKDAVQVSATQALKTSGGMFLWQKGTQGAATYVVNPTLGGIGNDMDGSGPGVGESMWNSVKGTFSTEQAEKNEAEEKEDKANYSEHRWHNFLSGAGEFLMAIAADKMGEHGFEKGVEGHGSGGGHGGGGGHGVPDPAAAAAHPCPTCSGGEPGAAGAAHADPAGAGAGTGGGGGGGEPGAGGAPHAPGGAAGDPPGNGAATTTTTEAATARTNGTPGGDPAGPAPGTNPKPALDPAPAPVTPVKPAGDGVTGDGAAANPPAPAPGGSAGGGESGGSGGQKPEGGTPAGETTGTTTPKPETPADAATAKGETKTDPETNAGTKTETKTDDPAPDNKIEDDTNKTDGAGKPAGDGKPAADAAAPKTVEEKVADDAAAAKKNCPTCTEADTPPKATDLADEANDPGHGISDEKMAQLRADKAAGKTLPHPLDPEEGYVTKEYHDAHLDQFKNGGSRLMSKANLEKYGPSREDGSSFIMPKHEVDALLAEHGDDPNYLEDAVGIPRGQLSSGKATLVRVDIPDTEAAGLRMPTGNEKGANDQWLPGGKLPGGNSEAVVDLTKGSSAYTSSDVVIPPKGP